jgi:hypothetical protein
MGPAIEQEEKDIKQFFQNINFYKNNAKNINII